MVSCLVPTFGTMVEVGIMFIGFLGIAGGLFNRSYATIDYGCPHSSEKGPEKIIPMVKVKLLLRQKMNQNQLSPKKFRKN